MAVDPSTGFGLSVQPLYTDNTSPPFMLIVGSYYPLGSLPEFTNEFKQRVEHEASEDLGAAYSVSAAYTKMPPLEAIELTVLKK